MEGHKEGVLFTVHEENKSPITVHEENKSPITVHEDNKHIYSTCCQFMKHVYDSTHNSHIYIYIYISHVTFEPKSYIINMNICKVSNILISLTRTKWYCEQSVLIQVPTIHNWNLG